MDHELCCGCEPGQCSVGISSSSRTKPVCVCVHGCVCVCELSGCICSVHGATLHVCVGVSAERYVVTLLALMIFIGMLWLYCVLLPMEMSVLSHYRRYRI